MENAEKCISGLIGKPERNRSLRKYTCRLEDNIKTDLKGTEW
jgi:hypothetical protein